MSDGMWLIYDVLKDDEIIKEYCTSDRDGLRVRFFKYPETADMTGNWIVIDSLLNELPSNFSDNTWVAYDYLFQIEVWSKDREDNRILGARVRGLLWEKLGFKQKDSINEFDKSIYRDASRKTGKLHKQNI